MIFIIRQPGKWHPSGSGTCTHGRPDVSEDGSCRGSNHYNIPLATLHRYFVAGFFPPSRGGATGAITNALVSQPAGTVERHVQHSRASVVAGQVYRNGPGVCPWTAVRMPDGHRARHGGRGRQGRKGRSTLRPATALRARRVVRDGCRHEKRWQATALQIVTAPKLRAPPPPSSPWPRPVPSRH